MLFQQTQGVGSATLCLSGSDKRQQDGVVPGVVLQERLRQRRRSLGLAALRIEALEPGGAPQTRDALTLEHQPVGERARQPGLEPPQQRAAVQPGRVVGAAFGHRALEPLEVRIGLPPETIALLLQREVGGYVARPLQHLAQVASRQRLGSIGPEQLRQFVAGNPRAPAGQQRQQQIGPLSRKDMLARTVTSERRSAQDA